MRCAVSLCARETDGPVDGAQRAQIDVLHAGILGNAASLTRVVSRLVSRSVASRSTCRPIRSSNRKASRSGDRPRRTADSDEVARVCRYEVAGIPRRCRPPFPFDLAR